MANSIILLRGLTRGQHHWGAFIQQLQSSLPHKKIIAIDLAGNGERYNETSPNTIRNALEDIRNQLKKESITTPVDVVALSLGGMITLQWLIDYPDEINKSLVINSSHAGLSPLAERMRPLGLLKLVCAITLPVFLRELIIYGVTSNTPINQNVLGHWIREAKAHPIKLSNAYRQAQAARRFKPPLIIKSNKLLILTSAEDQLVNARSSHKIAEATQARIEQHISAGHEMTLDDPLWVIDKIKRFIQPCGEHGDQQNIL